MEISILGSIFKQIIRVIVGRHLFLHFELINIHSCLDFSSFQKDLGKSLPSFEL